MPQLPATIIFIVSGEFELGFYCNTVIGGVGAVTFGILQYVREDLSHCTVLELTDAHV